MENIQAIESIKPSEQNENNNEGIIKISHPHDITKQSDALPNQTLYLNNLNEKIKTDGKFLFK